MLKSLYVSGLALIRRLSLDLGEGFTVLTGETGAGKSLVLDCLNLFLKPGSGKDLVRRGEKELTVELFFDGLSPSAARFLAGRLSPEEIGEGITLARTVTAAGKSSFKLCGRALTPSEARAAAEQLLAIHGQNDTGRLLDEKNHPGFLDDALPEAGQRILTEYGDLWERFAALEKELASWDSGEDPATLLDVYDYQIKEIARLKPKRGEEEALEEKLIALQGAEKTNAALRVADRALSGGEKGRGAAFLLAAAADKLEGLDEEDPLAQKARSLAAETAALAEDVSRRYASFAEEDPAETIDRVQARLDKLFRLKSKYGGTMEGVFAAYERAVAGRDRLSRRAGEVARLEGEKKKLLSLLTEKGEQLSKVRRETARILEEEIRSLLAFLDMPGSAVRVRLDPLPAPGKGGLEKAVFLLAANAGEGEKPLAKVASGGELSRIMLALQLKLGKAKTADTVVFDEIDTGISGATAQKIGLCLKALGESRQVLCVTHSAQVATLADHHLKVEKREEDGRTETVVRQLSGDDSLEEIARILGGKTPGQATRENALALREEGLREYKLHKGSIG